MLKKITSVVAAVAITLAGLGALPANATGFTPNANSNAIKRMWSSTLPVSGQFTVPANTNSMSIGKSWRFSGTKTADVTSKTISVDWTLTKPDGTVLGSSSSNNAGFYASASGNLSNGQGASVNGNSTSGTSFALTGATGITYTSGSIYFNLGSSNSLTSTVSPGQYSFTIILKVNGTEYTDLTTSGSNTAWVESSSLGIYGLPTLSATQNVDYLGLGNISLNSITCLDTSALAVGDVVTARQTVDGVAVVSDSAVQRHQSPKLFNAISNRYLNFDWSISDPTDRLTITQNMLDKGVYIEGTAQFLDPTGTGSNITSNNSLSTGNHSFGISVTTANGTEVTTGCFPEAAPTPVASLMSTAVTATSTGTFSGSSDYSYFCRVYKVSDNSLLLDNVYGSTGMYDPTIGGYPTVTCNNISGLPGGTAVYVKLYKSPAFYPGWASASAASNTVTVPSSGVTFTTTPSNGTTFGAVKGLTPFDQLALTGAGTQFTGAIAEPTGGVFEFTRKGTAIAVRHIKTTGLDTGFGTATHTSTAPSFSFGTGVHGSLTAPKPFVTLMTQGQTPDLVVKDWNYDGTAGNTRTVAAADISALCVSTFGQTMSMSAQMYAVSSPSADAYVQAKCSTSAGTYNEGWMLMKVSLTGTSAPTLVANLGVADATYPRFNTSGDMSGPNGLPVSINWTATGSTPVLTFAAVPMNSTCANGPCVSVYGTSKFVRIAATGAVTSTATGISSTVNAGENLSINLGAVNFGTLIVARYASICVQSGCTNTKTTFKVGATGGATEITPTWDTVSGWTGVSNFGTVLGSTADGQLVFIRSQSVAGTTSLKMAKMNLSTGAVTTFGETISYAQSGVPINTTTVLGGNSFMMIASSAVNAGKFDVLLGVGGGSTTPVAPTVPVPTQTSNTNLGLGLNAGGNKIEITGTLLTAITGITFNGVALPANKFVKTATKITITVPAGTTGTVAVALVHAGGTIPVGNYEYIGATKVAQTIAISAGSEIFSVGDADRVLAPTSTFDDDADANTAAVTTGLSVSILSKTPAVCTVAQNLLHFVAPGTCTIEGTQAGSDRYAAGTKVTKVFYVLPTYTGASALYSTDGGKPTITLTGTGLTSVNAVKLGGQVVTDVKSNATGTLLTVKIPVANPDNVTANTVDLKLVYGNPASPLELDTQDDFTFVGGAKITQTINLNNPPTSATYGDGIITLGPTSKDTNDNLLDLVIVIKSQTPKVCTVDEYDVTIVAGGDCKLVASQAGNAGVAKAADVQIPTIVVAKKAQVITIADTTLAITDIETIASGIALDSAEEMDLEYSVNNEDFCTIDADGVITGVSVGQCIITVSQPGDARYSPATSGDGYTVTVDVTTSTVVPDDIAPADGDGSAPAQAIPAGGLKSFASTNDPGFKLAWDKASGKLIPRASGIYTGFIQVKMTFTKNNVTYTCTNVFGSNVAMKNKKPAEKKAAKANKVFTTTTAFCTDPNEIKPSLYTSIVLNQANFAKIKPSAKAAGAVATAGTKKYEAAAFALLKNFTGTVSFEIKRFRAWPTTGVNVTGDKKNGKKIPVTTRNTSVVLQ